MAVKKKLFRLLRIIKIWFFLTSREAQIQLLTSWAGIMFIIGKIIRFLLFFAFLFVILSSAKTLVGYTREQIIFFFLVFNLVDIMVQFLYRGIYGFRFRVVNGLFDLALVKPWPSFFKPVFGGTDIMDFAVLIPLWIYFIWYSINHQLIAGPQAVVLFFLLLINSLLIGFAFHLFICAVCVMTLRVDHLVWIYRDLTSMARFPTDIYQKGIQLVLTFTIPVIILITVPAKALLGLLSWQWILLSFLMGGVLLLGSLKFWYYSLTRYSSASS